MMNEKCPTCGSEVIDLTKIKKGEVVHVSHPTRVGQMLISKARSLERQEILEMIDERINRIELYFGNSDSNDGENKIAVLESLRNDIKSRGGHE